MKRKPLWKRLLLAFGLVLGLAGLAVGIRYAFTLRKAEPVPVYAFSKIGVTEYWGDSRECYGPVSTDRIQTIFLSDTQTVTKVFVSVGDTVKKGDPLLSYDTTLSDLSLERKRLEVERLKLRLEDAKAYLKEIKRMKPMVIPASTPTPDAEETPDLGTELWEPYRISTQTQYDGSAPSLALICWLRTDAELDDAILYDLFETAKSYQLQNQSTPEPSPSELPDPSAPPVTEAPIDPDHIYVVIKVSENNRSLGMRLTWQGLRAAKTDSGFALRFFDAAELPDHTIPSGDAPVEDEPFIDLGSGFTSAQLKQMRSEQEKVIRDLEFSIKLEEANYQIMLAERNDGTVRADIDGVVNQLLSAEEAAASMQPMLKVSGGGGFTVSCSVSELERASIHLGQEVTVNDWSSGMTYTGTIKDISDFPASDQSFTGYGNPYVSYYPFTVFVDESAALQEGTFVSVQFSAGTSESGIYLEQPFLRTEQGRSFVYVMNADGLLEKRFVTTGKSLWGSYVEILSGLTAEDFLAFPYGKHLKEGAPAVESELDTLYGF